MKPAHILIALAAAASVRAQEFSGSATFDGSPGVKFARCSEKPSLQVEGKRSLSLLVRAEGRARRLVVIPEIDGNAQKGKALSITRSPLKSDKGKALSLEAHLELQLPAGAKSVSFHCVGADDAFLGVRPADLAALPELPSGPPAPAPAEAAPPELAAAPAEAPPPLPEAAPPELPAAAPPPELPVLPVTPEAT